MGVKVIRYGNPVKGVSGGVKEGNLAIAINVTAQAKRLSPFDEGRLRNSIMYKVHNREGGFNDQPGVNAEKKINVNPKENDGYVGTATEYAPYMEFGTRKTAPKPYLRPAIALVAKGADSMDILAKIQREQMNGALKRGQKREVF